MTSRYSSGCRRS